MENVVLVKVLLSVIFAGIWVTLITILSEIKGSKIGGLIGNLPSKVFVSLLFIGWTQTPELAADAARVVPFGMAVDAVFLFVLIATFKKYSKISVLLAFICWFVLAYAFAGVGYNDPILSTFVFIVLTVIFLWAIEKYCNVCSTKNKSHKPYSSATLLTRGLLTGAVVGTSVTISLVVGPMWGGIMSTFPAVIFSTIYILNKEQGPDFAREIGKVMLLSSASIIVYAFAVMFTYPAYGLIWGTVISYAAALISIVIMEPIMEKMK